MPNTQVNKNETYVCVRECYTYNKRFKVGDKFPYEWLQADYYPNQHFMPEALAKAVLRDHKKGEFNRPTLCAGDDSRSTADLMARMGELGASIDPKWGRQQIWARLNELETAHGKTVEQQKRGPGRPAKEG